MMTPMIQSQSQPPHISPVSGTLNLVLANKNGFVIATDSRGSWSDSGTIHRDDGFQKLFRTGKRSALAIAGLLATPPEAYRFESSSIILARFGVNGMPDGRGNAYFIAPWIQHQFGVRLRALAAVLSTRMETPHGYGFVATIAGYDTDNTARLSQIKFEPETRASLINGKPIWMMKLTQEPPTAVGAFAFQTAGKKKVADAVLNGTYVRPISAFMPYLKALSEGTTGELAIVELAALTKAIFEMTMTEDHGVGGDVQMAVIPSNGDAEWNLKPVAQPNILLGGAELIIGGARSSIGEIEPPAHYEMAQTFDTLHINRLFVASKFSDLTLLLDENHFFGCTFERCALVYKGSQKSLFEWNITIDCSLEIENVNEENIAPAVRQLRFDCPPPDENASKHPRLPANRWEIHTG
jgi:hypothetical protein